MNKKIKKTKAIREKEALTIAVKKVTGLYNLIARQFGEEIARKSFYLLARKSSKKRVLLEEKKILEKKLEEINKRI